MKNMGSNQVTENFMPSEVARLVLGYLKDSNCHNTWETFLSESSDLYEYKKLFLEGKQYPTNFCGKGLLQILQYYYQTVVKEKSVVPEIRGLIGSLESSVAQVKHLLSSEQFQSGTPKQLSIGCISRQTTLQRLRTKSDIAAAKQRNVARNAQNCPSTDARSPVRRSVCQSEPENNTEQLLNDGHNDIICQQVSLNCTTSVLSSPTTYITRRTSNINSGSTTNNSNVNNRIPCERKEKSNRLMIPNEVFQNVTRVTSVSSSLTPCTIHRKDCTNKASADIESKRRSHSCHFNDVHSSVDELHQNCHQSSQPSLSLTPLSSNNNHCAFVTQCHRQTLSPNVVSTGLNHSCSFSIVPTSSSTTPITTGSSIRHNKSLSSPLGCHNKTNGLVGFADLIPDKRKDVMSTIEPVEICDKNCSITRTPKTPQMHIINDVLISTPPQKIRTYSEPVNNFPVSTGIVESLPRAFFSQQHLLPPLTTPVKNLLDYDDYYHSPKRKRFNLYPRRKLLSSFSPTAPQNVEVEPAKKDAGVITDVTSLPTEEMVGLMSEELVNFHPLLEKIAENINKVVSSDYSQTIEPTKFLIDNEISLSSQESHLQDSQIRDIINLTESDPVFEEAINKLFEKIDSNLDDFENDDINNDMEVINENNPEQEANFTPSSITDNVENHSDNNPSSPVPTEHLGTVITDKQSVDITANAIEKNKESLMSSTSTSKKQPNASIPITTKSNEVQNAPIVTSVTTCGATENANTVMVTTNTRTETVGNVISTVVKQSENGNVWSNELTNTLMGLSAVNKTPVKIAVPDFQIFTLSPNQLYGFSTVFSVEPKKPQPINPKRICPKVTDASEPPSTVNANSQIERRNPKWKRQRQQWRNIKPKVPRTNGNKSVNQIGNLQSNPIANETILGAVNNSFVSPCKGNKNKIPQTKKASPQLKSLVSTAQNIAGQRSYLSKAHVRALDFGPQANSANNVVNYMNNVQLNNHISHAEGQPINIELISESENQVLTVPDNQKTVPVLNGYFNGMGDLVILLNNAETVSDNVVTLPYNNKAEASPPVSVTYVPDVSTYNTESVVQDQFAVNENASQINETNDSEVAETLVSMASGVLNCPNNCTEMKNKTVLPKEKEKKSRKGLKPTLPKKRTLRPREEKSQEKLLQRMDVDKFLSRVHKQ